MKYFYLGMKVQQMFKYCDRNLLQFPQTQSTLSINFFSRSPASLAQNSPKYAESTPEKRAELERQATPAVSRYIYLVRHGHYKTPNHTPNLTSLGMNF